jgi:glycosyltransferase involved in cell wall biosynthesis
MRIFLGLTDVSGYASQLKRGFQQHGIEVTLINLGNRYLQHGGDDIPNLLVRLARYCADHQRAAKGKNRIRRIFWLTGEGILRVLLLIWALVHYDAFIFLYKSSFLFLYDLPLYKLFGKKLIFVMVGSDARPPYINGVLATDTQPRTLRRIVHLTKIIKRQIKQIERYADVIVSHPLFAQFETRPFIGHIFIAFPSFPPDFTPTLISAEPTKQHRVRILHAPSRPEAKGTPLIREAVAHLQAKGFPVDLVEITGLPNAVVLRELAACDFVFDQAYSDAFMPGLATEAAFFGKAVVIAGYELGELSLHLPAEVVPPVLFVHPSEIEAAVEKLITDESFRDELGHKCKSFVENYATPEAVAARYLRLLRDDIPAEWISNPMDSLYVYGGGIPEVKLISFLQAYLEYGGREALGLSERPDLEARFLNLASRIQNPLANQ